MDDKSEALDAIAKVKSTLISVATGGPKIDLVRGEYLHQRRRAANALERLGFAETLPYPDLWDWYGRWSQGDLPSYQSRRQFVGDLFQPFIDRLSGTGLREPDLTGWERVDRAVTKAHKSLSSAQHEEDYQSVGHLCREILISLAQEVWDEAKHPITDVVPSPTDAKRMLDAFLTIELASSSNEAARRLAKTALDLANALQHRRTASFKDAAMCLEATTLVVNFVSIVLGRKGPLGR